MNMDDVKAMIRAATEKNAVAFQDAFATVMSDKVNAALAAKYDTMFGSAEEETAEEEADVDPDLEQEEGQDD